MRPFGANAVVGLVDKDGPQLYMFEPSGVYWVKLWFGSFCIKSLVHFRVINVVPLVKANLSQKLSSRNWIWPHLRVAKLSMKSSVSYTNATKIPRILRILKWKSAGLARKVVISINSCRRKLSTRPLKRLKPPFWLPWTTTKYFNLCHT